QGHVYKEVVGGIGRFAQSYHCLIDRQTPGGVCDSPGYGAQSSRGKVPNGVDVDDRAVPAERAVGTGGAVVCSEGIEAADECVFEFRKRRAFAIIIKDWGNVADFGQGKQSLVASILASCAGEEVRACRRGSTL